MSDEKSALKECKHRLSSKYDVESIAIVTEVCLMCVICCWRMYKLLLLLLIDENESESGVILIKVRIYDHMGSQRAAAQRNRPLIVIAIRCTAARVSIDAHCKR